MEWSWMDGRDSDDRTCAALRQVLADERARRWLAFDVDSAAFRRTFAAEVPSSAALLRAMADGIALAESASDVRQLVCGMVVPLAKTSSGLYLALFAPQAPYYALRAMGLEQRGIEIRLSRSCIAPGFLSNVIVHALTNGAVLLQVHTAVPGEAVVMLRDATLYEREGSTSTDSEGVCAEDAGTQRYRAVRRMCFVTGNACDFCAVRGNIRCSCAPTLRGRTEQGKDARFKAALREPSKGREGAQGGPSPTVMKSLSSWGVAAQLLRFLSSASRPKNEVVAVVEPTALRLSLARPLEILQTGVVRLSESGLPAPVRVVQMPFVRRMLDTNDAALAALRANIIDRVLTFEWHSRCNYPLPALIAAAGATIKSGIDEKRSRFIAETAAIAESGDESSSQRRGVRLQQKPAIAKVKSTRFACEECGKSFARRLHLRDHMTCVHLKERRFRCERCERVFTTMSNMRQHFRAQHMESASSRPHACTFCDARFVVRSKLMRHLANVHPER
eukprot:CAMPEP_0185829828 /NCGR_PEP_ID=MMETSP1353-20130828/472_1 /TAXON_ID=1077150 /ORGANISM="Erythrolobus australicus, Strain CCMP3124" /LENGTH=503 /DNA_ID=CAMNT_0028527659 /DNA_START=23 /DNA_END=1534 /DNA_ORIENTATION=+